MFGDEEGDYDCFENKNYVWNVNFVILADVDDKGSVSK